MYSRLITPERIHHWGEEDLLEATEQDRARIVQAAPVRRLHSGTNSPGGSTTGWMRIDATGSTLTARLVTTSGPLTDTFTFTR